MQLCLIRNRAEADELIAFVLNAGMFATPLTPGEEHVIRSDPYESLDSRQSAYWLDRDDTGCIMAAIGIREHGNQTGIYEMTCIAVSAERRQRGLGTCMLETVLQYIAETGGRGMLVDTSDHPAYIPMHRLLKRCGFSHIGHLPEFYYPGEGTHFYYRLLEDKGTR